MIKHLTVGLMVVVALAVAGVAIAGGSLPAAGSGTIALASVDGQRMAAGATMQPHYQSTVAFNYAGTGRLKNPRAYVRCYQNGELVYGEAGHAWDTFTLGGGMSQWVLNGGGAATCWADLYYFKKAGTNNEWNGNGQQEYVWLATTPQWEAAA
jgi:hypothetical protein